MSSPNVPIGTTLTLPQMHTIMPCDGNFSLNRIEAERGGETTERVFEPPYKLSDGETYAIYETPTGAIELWQVECIQRGEWRWMQEAKRARAKKPISLAAVNGARVS